MRQRVVPLSDVQLRTAKPKEKDYKLSDGQGLYLLINTTGGKLWRFDYSFRGKRKTLAFGSYPTLSLSDARQRREDAKKLIANGTDPSDFKKDQKTAIELAALNTFEAVTLKWFETHKGRWSEGHSKHILSRFENDIFPIVGANQYLRYGVKTSHLF
jgi:hypothetical protein